MNVRPLWLSNCYINLVGDRRPASRKLRPNFKAMYYLKKNAPKPVPAQLSLGDLIQAVSESSKNQRETVATVADLLASGRVRVQQRRAHVTF